VRINIDGNLHCSGAIFSKELIVTVAHFVFGAYEDGVNVAFSVIVSTKYKY
jgi:hypothetical protein